MQNCFLTIETTTDGVVSTINRKGEMEKNDDGVFFRYREENALVSISLLKKQGRFVREGDYALYIPLKEKAQTVGKIGFGDSVGNVNVFCERFSYVVMNVGVLASIKYTLDFGNEKQEMQIRLTAREEKTEEK